jgi:galactoside O-acetyltransferase
MAFLSREQLEDVGFESIGANVLISDKASLYNPGKISIGNNVRIDDFCVLSAGEGGIVIRDYVHIAVFSLLIGAGKIVMDDFSGLSSRVSIYSSNDDYSGSSLTNPTVPEQYRSVSVGNVYIGKHVIIGASCVILPDVNIGEGAAVGALSLVTKSCKPLRVYSGVPARPINDRKQGFKKFEQELLSRV